MVTLYLIRNKANGKVYVGQTVTKVYNRFNGHCADARQQSRNALHCAIRKYGPKCFEVLTLCAADDADQANRLEKAFILLTYSNRGRGYNMTDGGKNKWTCTDEVSQRIKAGFTLERRERYRKRMKGRVVSR